MNGWIITFEHGDGTTGYVGESGLGVSNISNALVHSKKRDALDDADDDEQVVKVKWTPKKVKVVQ